MCIPGGGGGGGGGGANVHTDTKYEVSMSNPVIGGGVHRWCQYQ